MQDITIERLEQIEAERKQTYADGLFQSWMKELHVSRLYEDHSSRHNARSVMEQWPADGFVQRKGIRWRIR
jgi:hypothetical protein